MRRIFQAKGRPPTHPLIVHVPDLAAVAAVASSLPPVAARLAAAFWPGPLTLVLPRRPEVPPEVSAGLPTVGVRVPSHPVAHELLALAGVPVAAPSANLYTTVSPTSARHVEKGLGDRIDALLDGGETPLGIESTVVDCTGPAPALLRPGAVSAEELEAIAGPLARPAAPVAGAHLSPGQSAKHYAPRAAVRLVAEGGAAAAARALPPGSRVAVVARVPRPSSLEVAAWLQLPDEPRAYARQLYGALHAVEDAGATDAILEEVPPGPAWEAVRDRLRRAAG